MNSACFSSSTGSSASRAAASSSRFTVGGAGGLPGTGGGGGAGRGGAAARGAAAVGAGFGAGGASPLPSLAGTTTTFLHLLHLPRLPPRLSGTFIRAWQWGQLKLIAMVRTVRD